MENQTRVIGNQILDWTQCQGLINNKRNLLMGRQVVRDAVMVRDVSCEESEDFYNNLSTHDRAMVSKSGQQGICGEGENTLGWYDPDSDSLTKNPTHGRGILICQLYLNQGGRCAYTHTGPYNILDFQVEHTDYRKQIGDLQVFKSMSEEDFRADISSTELRAKQ